MNFPPIEPSAARGNSKQGVYHAGTLIYSKRTLAILFLWLLWGDFCFVLMEAVVPSIMPLKFNALGASNSVIGLVMITIPGLMNTICNPIISFRSDRHRSRWGRRIPFILFTLPFLVISLVAVAFSSQAGLWLHHHFPFLLARFSPAAVSVAIIGTALTLFSFFNTFVNSVFWYLFNDVVPESLLARFMSYFRTVSLCAGSFYSLVIFKHADNHSTEILAGAALVYFLGFGLMCLKVKEGNYPPPPEYVGNKGGGLAAIKTFGVECMGLPHYWLLFLAHMSVAFAYTGQIFYIFFYKSLGLDLGMIGKLGFGMSISGALVVPFSGWLADKYHPIRVVIGGVILQLAILPIHSIWLFWHPSATIAFTILFAMNVCLFAPVGAMISVFDPPLLMRIFPRTRYGQFCSANSMCRSVTGIVGGSLVGIYLDVLKVKFGADTAYRLLPLWQFTGYAVMLFFLVKLYHSWQNHGGDVSYVPPLPSPTGEGVVLEKSVETAPGQEPDSAVTTLTL